MQFKLLRGLFLLLFLLATAASAQITEKRVLFVVETSRETKALAQAEQKLVSALVETGLGGLLSKDDTFGIWTFNDTLQTGRYPVQRWSPETAKEQAARLALFLQSQPHEKQPKLESIQRPLQAVVASSPALMVVLVTSGKHPVVTGTSFDAEINSALRSSYRDYQKQKTPAAILLSATSGKILRYSVSPAIGDVRIPLLTLPTITAAKPNSPSPKKEKKQAVVAAQPSPPPPAPKLSTNALVITKEGAQTVAPKEAEKIIAAIPIATPPPAPAPELPPVEAPAAILAPAIISSTESVQRVKINPIASPKNGAVEIEEVAPAVPQTEEQNRAEQPKPEAIAQAAPATPPPIIPEAAPAKVTTPPVEVAKAEPITAPVPVRTEPTPPKPVDPPVERKKPEAPMVPPVSAPVPPTKAEAPEPPKTIAQVAPPLVEPSKAEEPVAAPPITSEAVPPSSVQPVPVVAQTTPVRSTFPFLWIAGGLLLVAVVLAFFIGRHWTRRPQQSLVSDWAERDRTGK